MVKAQGNNKNTSVKATAVTASPNVNAKPVDRNSSVDAVNDLSKYYSDMSKHYSEQAQQSVEEAEESANRAEESAKIATNTADSIFNNKQIQEVLNNIDIIVASPENAQIAEDSATLAQSYSMDANNNANLAKGYAEDAKEYRDDAENILDSKQDKLIAGENITIENGVISAQGGGLQMFDTVLKDHILTFEESKGLALQGTWVYKEAVAGSRYGYADFYNKCLEEYRDSSNIKQYLKSNITKVGSVVDNQGVLSGFATANYATLAYYQLEIKQIDITFKFNSGATFTSEKVILGQTVANMHTPQIGINTKKEIYLLLSQDGTAWTAGIKSLPIEANTDYTVKVKWDGSKPTGTIIDANGNVSEMIQHPVYGETSNAVYWVEDCQIGTDLAKSVHDGSIDLNESYININGERWWTGADNLEYKKNSNGHLFYDISEKTDVDNIFATTGMAWFYGVDTENERIYLPRNNWFEQMTGDGTEVGSRETAGVPNITGSFAAEAYLDHRPDGAFYADGDSRGAAGGGADHIVRFDASRSNPIYGNSDTVQPNAVKKLLYICVGNTEVTSAVTDITEVTTTENDTLPLLTGMYFDFVPNNVSWLKGGEQVNSSGVYSTTYNELVNCLNGVNKYNIKVIDTTDMVSGVDYSLYWKVNQTDMTFITPSSAGLYPNNRILVAKKEPTDDDKSWYNLYSDGWLEQGGQATHPKVNANSGSTTVISLIKPFKDTNYNVTHNILTDSGDTTTLRNNRTTKATNTITFDWYSTKTLGGTGQFCWSADGYTEIPTVSDYTENVNLYFKVANAVQNLELLDAGKVLEAVQQVGAKPHIVETYVNGNSWYRVYSDGWCEQGGSIVVASGSQSGYAYSTTTLTLLKPLANLISWDCIAKHDAFGVGFGFDAGGGSASSVLVYQKNLTGDTYTNPFVLWTARGYIA